MTQPPEHAPPNSPAADVIYLRDPFGTLFAVEVLWRDRWDDALADRPAVAVADARVVLLTHGEVPRQLPGWLVVCASPADGVLPAQLPALAAHVWLRSPHHRQPGPAPEAYVRAGFHALCPPHPPCEFGPNGRETLIAFARGRPGPLGRLAAEGRDGFDRWLRVHWPTPAAFAHAILLARMEDAGAAAAAAAIRRLQEAESDPAGEFRALAEERAEILTRLDPLHYFVRIPAFEQAVADAEAWAARYAAAYAAHYRRTVEAARTLLAELAPATAAADALRVLNGSARRGAPVGEQALTRLDAAVAEIRSLAPVPPGLPAPGVMLGRVPAAFGEARLAAAAVLAAVDVQQRRAPI